jgi:hypothetical protein
MNPPRRITILPVRMDRKGKFFEIVHVRESKAKDENFELYLEYIFEKTNKFKHVNL